MRYFAYSIDINYTGTNKNVIAAPLPSGDNRKRSTIISTVFALVKSRKTGNIHREYYKIPLTRNSLPVSCFWSKQKTSTQSWPGAVSLVHFETNYLHVRSSLNDHFWNFSFNKHFKCQLKMSNLKHYLCFFYCFIYSTYFVENGNNKKNHWFYWSPLHTHVFSGLLMKIAGLPTW